MANGKVIGGVGVSGAASSMLGEHSFNFASSLPSRPDGIVPDAPQPNPLAAELTALVQSNQSPAGDHAGQVLAQGTMEHMFDHADHFLIR